MDEEDEPRLLIVDDEATLREPLAEYLARQGFAVTEADSAARARSLLRSEAPDLVLLDIMMPGEDGLSLCRHLVEARDIPVILLTAKGEPTDRIVGLASWLRASAPCCAALAVQPHRAKVTMPMSSMAGTSIRSNAG
jgi:two-component system OmpR family response regulator